MSKKRRGTRRAVPREDISAVLARHVDELVFEEARAREEKGEKTVLQQNEEEERHESDDETASRRTTFTSCPNSRGDQKAAATT